MLDSTLTPDRAMPMLLLMHQTLYMWKPTMCCMLDSTLTPDSMMGGRGGLHRGPGSIPSPQQGRFRGGARPGSKLISTVTTCGPYLTSWSS
jgi:hypothetical protein